MNSCNSTASIGAWLDGELSREEAAALRLHVEHCPACADERRQLEKLHGALKSVLDAEVARVALQPFWKSVERRISTKRSWREDLAERLRSLFPETRLAWAVPVVILLLLGVFSADSFLPRLRLFGQRSNLSVVESIDAHGRNVALLNEDETKTTVIWLYQNQEEEDESSGEATDTRPAF